MSTPDGGSGEHPNWSWQPPPPPPAAGDPGQLPPPGGAPEQAWAQPDYSHVQPDYGTPYGGAPAPRLAGFWIRFGAAFVDGIILGIVNQLLNVLVGFDAGNLLATIAGAAYFTYFHSSTGQSLGNLALGLKVVDQNTGGTIDVGRAFLRWVVSIASAVVLLLGYLWMLWDPSKQTWHDKAAGSLVIRTR